MSLTGWPFLLVLCLVSAALLVGVSVLWNRWPRRGQLALRALSLGLVMVLGAAIGGTLLNRQFDFYSSFSDLLGRPPSVHAFTVTGPPKAAAHVDIVDPNWLQPALAAAREDRGTLLSVKLPGGRSGIDRDGDIYLPAAYFRGDRNALYPVVEIFHGYPGHPSDFQRQLNLSGQLDAEIAAHRIPPVIAVLPRTYDTESTECVDGIDGERDETYLTQDVVEDVNATFRTLGGRTWATLGISTGGFCAANLAVHHPDLFAAGASLSGYFTAGEDPNTGRLYGGHGRYSRNANSPLWWVQHRSPVAPPLYLFASQGDPAAVKAVDAMAQALNRYDKALPTVQTTLLGGHNWNVWSVAFAPALDWIAQYLPSPLSPGKQLQPLTNKP